MRQPTWISTRIGEGRLRLRPEALPWIGFAVQKRRAGAWDFDLFLAGAFLAAMCAERFYRAAQIGDRMPAALALSVLIAGALAARRRAPLASYLLGTAALSAEALFVAPSPVSAYANLLGLYSLGSCGTRTRAKWGPVIALGGMIAYFSGSTHTYEAIPAAVLFVWLMAWALGYGAARRREEQETLRQAVRGRVVAEERAWIARELHDLVGHTLTVMLVQAGAARRVLDGDPERTRGLLGAMEDAGRQAMDELDRVLGLLSPAGTDPRPGPARLDALAARIGQAGIRVTARVDPAAYDVPEALDLSVYRIVQEALTNVVRHARATRVEVSVRRVGDALVIEVLDDGGAVGGYRPGRGLSGIAERVREFGGSVEHGRCERGGFRLHVMLPIPAARTPATAGR
ncbi:sensor histidine kinase [Actinospica robiniae]|uniref:sensor histidine kinase n=1 Tax=Actinospica robiniae TaxID=304901 RepID=UPI0003FD17C6|nr:sensor histidine kinase [Actinospica robiniae]